MKYPEKEFLELTQTHAGIIEDLFSNLNMDFPGLLPVKEAVEGEDIPEACRRLIEYYTTKSCWLCDLKPHSEPWEEMSADAICENVFTIQSVTAKQAVNEAGEILWHHKGPNDDQEWAWLLNRHAFCVNLLKAWAESKDTRYAAKFDQFIHDWIIHNPAPAESTDDAAWRVLEAGLRLAGSWPHTFYGFRAAPEFRPETKILMLKSLRDHGAYLRRYHARGHNHASMELHGLLLLSLAFPEFNDAESWYQEAGNGLRKELDVQRYPDGAQFELTSHYHWVTTVHLQRAYEHSLAAGRPLAAPFSEDMESMWNYIAYTIRPNGLPPLNNDSDLMDHRDDLLRYAKFYKREDWTAIVNRDGNGVLKNKIPSILFPWAGHMIMRSGWEKEAQWGFFDCGPWGESHQHNDHLHLSIHAGGRDLLVDSGRFAYHGSIAEAGRAYAVGSAGHNVLLMDGKGQLPGKKLADHPLEESQWLISRKFDYATSSYEAFEHIEGMAKHRRSVFYVRGCYWIVVDEVESDRPRTVEALWHFHPDCSVSRDGIQVSTNDKSRGNLSLQPSTFEGEIEIVRGCNSPYQGWYSPRYNEVHPAPCAVYKAHFQNRIILIWGITTAIGPVMPLQTELTEETGDAFHIAVTAPWEHRITVPKTIEVQPSFSG